MTDILGSLTITEDKTVRDAMILLNANGREVVLVSDAIGCISRLITDGDIRRGLIAGAKLVLNCKPISSPFIGARVIHGFFSRNYSFADNDSPIVVN
jgi:hypothetical protein